MPMREWLAKTSMTDLRSFAGIITFLWYVPALLLIGTCTTKHPPEYIVDAISLLIFGFAGVAMIGAAARRFSDKEYVEAKNAGKPQVAVASEQTTVITPPADAPTERETVARLKTAGVSTDAREAARIVAPRGFPQGEGGVRSAEDDAV